MSSHPPTDPRPRWRRHDGLVAWHRIDAVEAATRQIGFGIDGVLAFGAVDDPSHVLIDEHEVPLSMWVESLDIDRGSSVSLPEGWSPGLAPGTLVALAVEDGRLRLRAADDPALPPGPPAAVDESAHLGGALARLAQRAGGRLTVLADPERDPDDQWIVDLVEHGPDLLEHDPDAVAGLHRLPLREAIVRAGLRSSACAVAGPSVTAERLDTFMVGRIVTRGLPGGRLVEGCGAVCRALIGPLSSDADEVPTPAAVGALLDDPATCDLVVRHLCRSSLDAASDAERRMRAVCAGRPHGPGPAFVHATAMLRQGRSADAHELMERAVRCPGVVAPAWAPLLGTAARLRAHAGDVAGAVALGRAIPEDRYLAGLGRWVPQPPQVGRNEACPCGSGTKAKTCCLRRPARLPIGLRVDHLWQKLVDWAFPTPDVDEAPADHPDIDISLQVMMLEGGSLSEVLDEVGALLPSDERELAVVWRIARHALWVVEVADGGRVEWADAATGGRAVVVGRLRAAGRPGGDEAVTSPPPGSHVIAALLPGPAGHHVAGEAVTVPRDVEEVAAAMIRRGSSPAAIIELMLGLRQHHADGRPDHPPG